MPEIIGIDTSNYTTSAAVFVSGEMKIYQSKKLLPVKHGELGLRQSDAVFHHTKQLPEIIEELSRQISLGSIAGISASSRPRSIDGSYMPCFLCGEGFARSFAAIEKIPLYTTSHQVGHVLAALYSSGQLELVNSPFIAFHVSGGTTDCLLCEPDRDDILRITEIGTSLDLKAGQAVDRVGLMLGLEFPCGAALEGLAVKSGKSFKVKPVIRNNSCCLSGLENQCRKMLDMGEGQEDIAKYCLDFIGETIISMTAAAIDKCGVLPIVFAGGVMSDMVIREKIISRFKNTFFAAPEFSCDNAAGIAIYGCIRHCREHNINLQEK
ncbi:MAG: peptidase M22 [Ruminococcus sp.]|nr:peptidase M22 [Ruminococcus sp.]